MKILLIEDEEKAVRFLSKGLVEEGFVVDSFQNGGEGLTAAEMNRYDCLIIDANLPGMSGYEIVRSLRSKSNSTPIIMLTARDSVEDRIHGIESGSDVYLVKPFSFQEVLAYVRSLTSKRSSASSSQIKIGDLEIDTLRQKVKRQNQVVDLTAKEFQLLSLLARRSGQILSRTVIAEEVWGMNFDSGTNVVDVHIRRLRAKVDEPFSTQLIWTIRGSGYTLEER